MKLIYAVVGCIDDSEDDNPLSARVAAAREPCHAEAAQDATPLSERMVAVRELDQPSAAKVLNPLRRRAEASRRPRQLNAEIKNSSRGEKRQHLGEAGPQGRGSKGTNEKGTTETGIYSTVSTVPGREVHQLSAVGKSNPSSGRAASSRGSRQLVPTVKSSTRGKKRQCSGGSSSEKKRAKVAESKGPIDVPY